MACGKLSSIHWHVPQTRFRIYLVLVKDFLATAEQLATIREVFERSFPAKTRAGVGRSTINEVRKYVAEVLEGLEATPILPPRSEDWGRAGTAWINMGSILFQKAVSSFQTSLRLLDW